MFVVAAAGVLAAFAVVAQGEEGAAPAKTTLTV
jgi:hypothetical protein